MASRRKLEIKIGGDDAQERDDDHPAHRIFAAAKKGAASTKAGANGGARKTARVATSKKAKSGASLPKLSKSDKKVLGELSRLRDENTERLEGGADCVASIPEIAEACSISPRQVQESTKRLIAAGLIKRVAYDFGNSDRGKRGTLFKVQVNSARVAELRG